MPEKHHYLPVFYQKRWAGADGRCVYYSVPYKTPIARRLHPDRMGFAYDLYKIPGVDFENASYLERRFFRQTDNDAAQALSLIETPNLKDLDDRLKSGWARFIMSIIYRASREIEIYVREVARCLKMSEDVSPDETQMFDDVFVLSDQQLSSPDAIVRRNTLAGVAAVRLIQRLIDSQFVGDYLLRMKWAVLCLNGSYTLLTSDRPIVMTAGLMVHDGHLMIPIGPRKLFIAANERSTIQNIEQSNSDRIARFVNDRQARQARLFCIATNESHLQFFGKRFGERLPCSPTETAPLTSPKLVAELLLREVRAKTRSPT